jgi:hypothetical protein
VGGRPLNYALDALSPDRKLSLANFFSCALAVLWMKASAVYNWGNIGGRMDPDFNAWDRASGLIAYSSLAAWLVTVGLAIYLTAGQPPIRRLAWTFASALAPVVVGWAAFDWFHGSFPAISG